MNHVIKDDINYIMNSKIIDFEKLDKKNILITGATGLIGFNIVSALISSEYDITVIAVVRDQNKANSLFKSFDNSKIKYVVYDVTKPFSVDEQVDYIIHAASQTSSKSFINEPVKTIFTSIYGTKNLLEIAKEKNIDGFVYLSTMEVYGTPTNDDKISESYGTNLNTMSVRTSYPESKRMCENICKAYHSEFGIPIKVVRLTQTFGPGVQYNDGRVFAEFARCAIEGKNIVLHTKGETKRNYLYTADAVTAILKVLLEGESGEAYNAANEDTYCSIYEMAKLVADKCANNKIDVVINESDSEQFGYAPVLKMNLDTRKIQNLGWCARTGLVEMFEKLIASLMEER